MRSGKGIEMTIQGMTRDEILEIMDSRDQPEYARETDIVNEVFDYLFLHYRGNVKVDDRAANFEAALRKYLRLQ